MFKTLLRDRFLVLLLLTAILIKLFSLNAGWVERYYTYGFYPVISGALRFLLGWIPFSVGDLLYIAVFSILALKIVRLIHRKIRKEPKEYELRKYVKWALLIYIVFNIFWGLNYNREGIAHQFGLNVQSYNARDVYELCEALQQRLNFYAMQVDSVKRISFADNQTLFEQGKQTYERAAQQYPFLTYTNSSVKSSLFTLIGEYFGFTGYYNPFTGEAQLKTSVPVFVKPFILCHEMGHQLGYAKENEANVAAFLSGKVSDNIDFRYSAYYDVYTYAIHELYQYDTIGFNKLRLTAHPQFKKDYKEYMQYLYKSRNRVEPIMSSMYDGYLRMNNQPKGRATYNEVVAWLIAYMKRHGKEAL